MTVIHQTAIIEKGAQLAEDVEVGPYSVIGADVQIDEGTVIGPHVVLQGPTRIGKNNRIFQFASVGEGCQDKKYAGEPTGLEIGDNNIIRECVTIHRGTIQDRAMTTIGSGNLFMAYVHIAHDAVVGDNCILANNATLAGHVHVGDDVILGGFTGVHQFCKIGSYAMTSMYSAVNMDIPCFVMAQGYPAKPRGMNFEGMRRRGYSKALISTLRAAYKIIYRSQLKLDEALLELQQLSDSSGSPEELDMLIDSIKASTRGIIR